MFLEFLQAFGLYLLLLLLFIAIVWFLDYIHRNHRQQMMDRFHENMKKPSSQKKQGL